MLEEQKLGYFEDLEEINGKNQSDKKHINGTCRYINQKVNQCFYLFVVSCTMFLFQGSSCAMCFKFSVHKTANIVRFLHLEYEQ